MIFYYAGLGAADACQWQRIGAHFVLRFGWFAVVMCGGGGSG
jgi:hypothetical protein